MGGYYFMRWYGGFLGTQKDFDVVAS